MDQFNKETDLVMFFTPEASVTPHLVAQCLLAKTLEQEGYKTITSFCRKLFSRCPVMDMYSLPYAVRSPDTDSVCLQCQCQAVEILKSYQLHIVDLAEFVLPEFNTIIERELEQLPINLNEYQFEGARIGKFAIGDVAIAKKDMRLYHAQPKEAQLALVLSIQSNLLGYLITKEICKALPVKRIIRYNDYGINLAVMAAAKNIGIPCFTVSQASHRSIDRRRILILPDVWPTHQQKQLQDWARWRNLFLPGSEVDEIAIDSIDRLSSQASHSYSPAKSMQTTEEILELHKRCGDCKLLVAYTSSPDERLYSQQILSAFDIQYRDPPQTFNDHVDWLTALTEYVRSREDLFLIVRVHPREGANKRERNSSTHLEQLQAKFKGALPNCHFIWPEDQISSYDLAELADLVLTSWSSIGLELARLGVPVLTAFRELSFPTDDFLEWGGLSKDEYFVKLEQLLQRQPSIDTIKHAYRCYYMFQLNAAVDLSDVVSSTSAEGIVPFIKPRAASEVKEVIIDRRYISDLVHSKLSQSSCSSIAPIEEHDALLKSLEGVAYYLLTGEKHLESDRIKIRIAECDTASKQFRSTEDATAARTVLLNSNGEVNYTWNGKSYKKYSPLVNRLLRCIEGAKIDRAFCIPTVKQHIDWSVGADTIVRSATDALRRGNYATAMHTLQVAMEYFPSSRPAILEQISLLLGGGKQSPFHIYQRIFYQFELPARCKVGVISSSASELPFRGTQIVLREPGAETADSLPARTGIACNPYALPFKDGEFDFLYCYNELSSLADPKLACNEITRVAKAGFFDLPGAHQATALVLSPPPGTKWLAEHKDSQLTFSPYSEDSFRNGLEVHKQELTRREPFSTEIAEQILMADHYRLMLAWNEKLSTGYKEATMKLFAPAVQAITAPA